MYMIYDQLVQDYGAVTYEAFINLLVRASLAGYMLDLTPLSLTGRDHRGSNISIPAPRLVPRHCSGQGTPVYRCDHVWSSRTLLQPFVTELDLRLAQLPQSSIDYLREAMPPAQNESGEPAYDYEAWLDEVFS